MAQHDYIIANQSGAAFRADLNNGLAAIVSQNSGTAQPSTTYAYQWWADTTTGLLKLRNAANNAWITIGTLADANLGLLSLGGGTMTGALLADDSGTAALPAISFDGDSDTGIFRAGANELAAATNGTQRLTVDSGGRLLVGTSSALGNITRYAQSIAPTQQIVSNDTGSWNTGLGLVNYSATGYAPVLTLGLSASNTKGTNTLVSDGHRMGVITFNGNDGTDFEEGARIEAFVDGTPGANDMPGRLVFSTTSDSASSPTERLRIQSSGDLRIANATTFYPQTDNAVSLGSGPAGPFRFSAVWAANGTIQTSDQRAKADVADAALGSEFIKSLRPVSYKWVEGGKHDTGERDEDGNFIYESVPGTRTHWGFIAQEVKQVVDAAGVDFGGWLLTDKDDPDSQQALRYDQFIAPLTKALQETMAELEVLKAEVAALKNQ